MHLAHRWRGLLAVAVVGLIVAWLAIPFIARTVIRRQLQTMISDHLNARLEIRKLVYHAPYGVTVFDTSIITPGPDGKPLQLVQLPRVDLTLAKLPFGSGPLVIESLLIVDPAIHLIRAGAANTSEPPTIAVPTANTAPPSASATKLSDMFRLTHVALSGGQIVYDDRTRPRAVPLAWRNLNMDLRTTQQSPGNYAFHLAVNNSPLATLTADGSADIDDLLLRIAKCALSVKVDPGSIESALPAEHQELLQDWQVRGNLAMDLSAVVPLRSPGDSSYRVILQLNEAKATIPSARFPLDAVGLKVELSNCLDPQVKGTAHAPTVMIQSLDASASDAHVRLASAVTEVDLQKRTWKLTGLQAALDPGHLRRTFPADIRKLLEDLQMQGPVTLALSASGPLRFTRIHDYAARLEIQPEQFSIRPAAMKETIGGFVPAVITLADGTLMFEGLRGTFGPNLLYVKHASLSLVDLPHHLHVTDLAGCVTFGPEHDYPAMLSEVLGQFQPVGPFFFDGHVDIDTKKSEHNVDYDIEVHTRRGQMTVSDKHIPLNGIDMVATLRPAAIAVKRFEASVLEGSGTAFGTIHFTPRPAYQFNASLKNIDLKVLSEYLAEKDQPPPQLSGRGVLTAEFAGVIPDAGQKAYEGLMGDGEFEILNGDFFRIPGMRLIARSVAVKEAETVGEAAGQFHIGHNKIHFNQALASSPALGVEGTGDVGFDGSLDMKFVANAMGRWSDRVGAIDDGGGIAKLANKVQKGLDVATRQALYEIKVSGTTDKPEVHATAAPFISRQVSRLLDSASQTSRKTGLLDTLHQDSATTQPAH
jgi:hypothetical protein